MSSNYAIKPTPEQALRTNRAMPPARLIAALDFTMAARNYAMSFRFGDHLHTLIYSGRDFKVAHAKQFPEMRVLTAAVGVWDNFTVSKGMDTNAWTSRPASIPRWAVRNVVKLLEGDGDLFAYDYSFRSLYDTRWETRHSKPYRVNEDQIWIVPGAGELYLGHMEEFEHGRAVSCELDLRPFQKYELADGTEIRIRKKRCEFGLLAQMKKLQDFLEGLPDCVVEIRHHYEGR